MKNVSNPVPVAPWIVSTSRKDVAVLPINFYEQIIENQNDHIASLTNQLQQQTLLIQQQSEQIRALTLMVAELNEWLKKNSHNKF